jgi:CheY-like chemotaxis protein
MEVLGTNFRPSFICLDLNMPGADGSEILAYLQREPRFAKVPVFVVTSDDQPETRNKVLKLGAAALIVKPATIDALESVLKRAQILA